MRILCSRPKDILKKLYELIDTYDQLYLYVDMLFYDVIYSRGKTPIDLNLCEKSFNNIKLLRANISRSLLKISFHQALKRQDSYAIYKKDTYLMELIDELVDILCDKNSSFLDIKNLMDKADSRIEEKTWSSRYEMD